MYCFHNFIQTDQVCRLFYLIVTPLSTIILISGYASILDRQRQLHNWMFRLNTFQIRTRLKPHLEGYAVMSASADKNTRPGRWTTGFSPGGAI